MNEAKNLAETLARFDEDREIDEALFDLHIRFCPLVNTDTGIKQSDCNEHKDVLKQRIKAYFKSALEQSYQQGKQDGAKEVYMDLANQIPGDIHWANRTAFHKTETENERYDQGFNEYHRRMKKILKSLSTKFLKQ